MIGSPSIVATGAYDSPAITWNGNGWGVAWVKNEPTDASLVDQNVYLELLDVNGQPAGKPQVMTVGRDDQIYGEGIVSVAWSGKRIDDSGQVVGRGTKLTQQPVAWLMTPTLSWDGTQHVVSWPEQLFDSGGRAQHTKLHFVKLGSDGSESSSPGTVTTTFRSDDEIANGRLGTAAAWSGTQMAVVRDVTQGGGDGGTTVSGRELARLDLTGNLQGGPTPMNMALPASDPVLVWTAREYAVGWFDGPQTGPTLWFARFGTCP